MEKHNFRFFKKSEMQIPYKDMSFGTIEERIAALEEELAAKDAYILMQQEHIKTLDVFIESLANAIKEYINNDVTNKKISNK